MDVVFPVKCPPACLKCGRPCTRAITGSPNRNGNAGRPYYFCAGSSHDRKFACWDDDYGIHRLNSTCECNLTSREFTVDRETYFGCPVGACSWIESERGHFSDCSDVEETFGPPIVIGVDAQDDHRRSSRKPVKIELGAELQWEISVSKSGNSQLCSICRIALENLRMTDDSVTANVSPELRSRAGCHLCALFVHCATDRDIASRFQESTHVCRYEFEGMDFGQATLSLRWEETGKGIDSRQARHMSRLGCLPSADFSVKFTDGAFAGSFQRIIALARHWIQRCEKSHPSCQNEKGATFIPTRIIDVGNESIFHAHIKPSLCSGSDLSPDSRYLTLSHCWGGLVPMKLMTSNFSSLTEHIPFERLPKTFQDAIIVTQKLGYRYIWIDSLCIIQDDDQDWQREASLMAHVFKNSVCNLSAAGATNGLAGLFLDHNPILTKPVQAPFMTNSQGVVLHNFWPERLLSSLGAEPLMRRGWVLQERLISRRNIHFARDQAIWECRTTTACEIFPDKAPFKDIPLNLKHKFSRVVYGGDRGPHSHVDLWDELVSEYTSCDLKYPAKDKMIAFGAMASIFQSFSGRLGQRYIAGLWLENLAYQLCWIGRRRASPEYIAPSWAWASTEGYVRDAFVATHPSTVVRQMDVLEAHVELANRNPFGQLKGGYLRVVARLTVAKIAFEDSDSGLRKERLPVLFLPNVDGDYCRTGTTVSLSWTEHDILDAQRRVSASGVLYILAVTELVDPERVYQETLNGRLFKDRKREPSTRWLVLCPAGNEAATFTRCGSLMAVNHSHRIFTQACLYYDHFPERLPVYSYEKGIGSRYAITII